MQENERMAAKIVIPIVGKRGQKYDIVTLVEWKVGEGDRVEKGNIVLAVETEKASCDIEAEASGFLHILVQQREKAMVGAVVGLITETKKELEALQKVPPEKLAQQFLVL
jgi:pyruvate/2-oxoglutarate dehydrogenase complex dihydrolipoamide acyltransferase (E2) component